MNTELALARAFCAEYPEEVARFLELSSVEASAGVLGSLDVSDAANVVASIMPPAAAGALSALEPKLAAAILDALDTRVAADILFRAAPAVREALFAELPAARAQQMKTMTEYGPDCAGGRLDPRAPAMLETLSIAEVFERVRAFPAGALNYVYAVDSERRLTGVLSIRELMLAAPETPLGLVMTRDPEALLAEDSLDMIARHPGWKRRHALPVVDRDRRFLGALRYSTFRAIEAELGESVSGPNANQTASALAELCTLGTSAMARFIAASLALEPFAGRMSAPELADSTRDSSRGSAP